MLATVWAVWSLGWGFLWALTGIGIVVTLICIPVAIIPFFFIRDRKSYANHGAPNPYSQLPPSRYREHPAQHRSGFKIHGVSGKGFKVHGVYGKGKRR